MSLHHAEQLLEAAGWKYYPDPIEPHARPWFRTFDGVQVEVRLVCVPARDYFGMTVRLREDDFQLEWWGGRTVEDITGALPDLLLVWCKATAALPPRPFIPGSRVVYRSHSAARGEAGTVTSTNATFVFVRFDGSGGTPAACPPERLTLLDPEPPKPRPVIPQPKTS